MTEETIHCAGPPGTRARSSGPWGDLHYVRIVIAPPLEFVGDAQPAAGLRPWCFPGISVANLDEFLSEAGLTTAQRQSLTAAAQPDDACRGCRAQPSEALVHELESAARGRLYHWLGCWPQNPLQNNAFRFCGETPDDWFHESGLSPATLDLVAPYLYRHGRFLFCADYALILPRIADKAERSRLLKALAGEVTMLVKLHVAADAPLHELVAYWSQGRRHKDIRPLLESLSRCPGGEIVDVVHLLPAFARRLLYTYPQPPRGQEDSLKDCHWTSLNFFNELPDHRFLDLEFVVRTIERDYCRIYHEPTFGDLVILCTPAGEVFHSAVYIADEFTFTKQGATISRPWMFMRIDDLRDFYPRREPVEVRYYRRREAL